MTTPIEGGETAPLPERLHRIADMTDDLIGAIHTLVVAIEEEVEAIDPFTPGQRYGLMGLRQVISQAEVQVKNLRSALPPREDPPALNTHTAPEE